jgi:hypothetical protein
MKTLSVEQQIHCLRSTMDVAAQMHAWFLLGAAFGVIASLVLGSPIPLVFSVFLAVVGFAEQRACPNIIAAVSAYDSGLPSLGSASIAITCWDMDNHFHVVLREEGYLDWTYEFIPQGWQPAAGMYAAKVWRKGLDDKPVLAVVDGGIMVPRREPRVISDSCRR